MKSLFCALALAVTLSASSGCCLFDWCCHKNCGDCDQCSDHGCSYCGGHCGACGCHEGGCGCGSGGCGPGGCAHCGGGGDGYAASGYHGGGDGYAAAGPRGSAYAGGFAANGGCRNCPHCHGAGCAYCAASPIPNCANDHAAIASQLGGPAGPPAANVTYPYYTTRGPRDFFANCPPSIGP